MRGGAWWRPSRSHSGEALQGVRAVEFLGAVLLSFDNQHAFAGEAFVADGEQALLILQVGGRWQYPAAGGWRWRPYSRSGRRCPGRTAVHSMQLMGK